MCARSIATLCALGTAMCGTGEDSAPESVTTNAAAPAPVAQREAPAPRHGGSVILAGEYAVEVLPQSDGKVFAYIVDRQAAPVPSIIELSAKVTASDQALHDVALVWNPIHARFEGTLSAGIAPIAGPLQIAVVAEGRSYSGQLAAVSVLTIDARAPRVQMTTRHANVAGEAADARARVDLRVKVPRPPRIEIRGGAGFSVGARGGISAGAGGSN